MESNNQAKGQEDKQHQTLQRDKEQLVSTILNQAVDILQKFGNIISVNLHNISIKDPSGFMDLSTKARALVAYVDSFVLEKEEDKITEVICIGEYEQPYLEKYYGHMRYATGLLNTVVTLCRWKQVPSTITKQKTRIALNTAIIESNHLMYYARESRGLAGYPTSDKETDQKNHKQDKKKRARRESWKK